MKRLFKRRASGFTLLETLVAGVIIIVAVTASAAAGRLIQQSATKAQETARVNSLINEGVGELAAAQYTTTAPTSSVTSQKTYLYWSGCVDGFNQVDINFNSPSTAYGSLYTTQFSSTAGGNTFCGNLEGPNGYNGYVALVGNLLNAPTVCSSIEILQPGTSGPGSTLIPANPGFVSTFNAHGAMPVTSLTPLQNTASAIIQIADTPGHTGDAPYSFLIECDYTGTSSAPPASFYQNFTPTGGSTTQTADFYWSGCINDITNVKVNFSNLSIPFTSKNSGMAGTNQDCRPNLENTAGYTGYGTLFGASLPSGQQCTSVTLLQQGFNGPTSTSSPGNLNPGFVKNNTSTLQGASNPLPAAQLPTTTVNVQETDRGSKGDSAYSFLAQCAFKVSGSSGTYTSPFHLEFNGSSVVTWVADTLKSSGTITSSDSKNIVTIDNKNYQYEYFVTPIGSDYLAKVEVLSTQSPQSMLGTKTILLTQWQ